MAPAFKRDIHGVPLWLLREYLEEMGGTAVGEGQVTGEGWHARFWKIDPYRIGSLSIGRVHLEIDGDEQVLSAFLPKLELKLIRGGG